jgi:transposase InsO family protein
VLDPIIAFSPSMTKSANGAGNCGAPSIRSLKLLAEGPNQVWSWDTKLMGPAKWSYFYLYVIIDIFSRRIVA